MSRITGRNWSICRRRMASCSAGRRAHRLGAQFDQPLGHVGVLHGGNHFAVQAVDDVLGRLGRGEDAVPAFELEVGEAEFAHRRHVGQHRHAARGRGGQRLQAAGLDLGQRGGQLVAAHLDAAGQHLLLQRRRALEGDVLHVHLGLALERLAEHVHRGARAGGAVVVLQAGVAAQQRGQLLAGPWPARWARAVSTKGTYTAMDTPAKSFSASKGERLASVCATDDSGKVRLCIMIV